jgi:DNA-binding beta-propeller fold protein YncE
MLSHRQGFACCLAAMLALPVTLHADELFVSSFSNDRVYQLNASTGAIIRTYTALGNLDSPTGLALSPDRSILYVGGTNASNSDVYLFNTSTGALITSYATNLLVGARGLSLNAAGTTLYVSGIGTDNIVSFNTTTGAATVLPTATLTNPQGIRVSPGGNSLYVANSGGNNSREVSLATGATIRTFTAPGSFYSPSDVTTSVDGSTLFVSTFGDSAATNNQILRYAATGTYLGSFTVSGPEGDMYGMALNTTGSTLFVADVFNSTIRTIDTASGTSGTFATEAVLSAPAFMLYVPTAVPEPTTIGLIGISLAGACYLVWRRQRTSQRQNDAVVDEGVEA